MIPIPDLTGLRPQLILHTRLSSTVGFWQLWLQQCLASRHCCSQVSFVSYICTYCIAAADSPSKRSARCKKKKAKSFVRNDA